MNQISDSDNEESLSLSFNINENTEKEEIQPKDIPALSLAVPNSLRYTHEREGPNYGSFEIEGEIFKFRASGLNNSHDEYEPIPDGLVTEIIRFVVFSVHPCSIRLDQNYAYQVSRKMRMLQSSFL